MVSILVLVGTNVEAQIKRIESIGINELISGEEPAFRGFLLIGDTAYIAVSLLSNVAIDLFIIKVPWTGDSLKLKEKVVVVKRETFSTTELIWTFDKLFFKTNPTGASPDEIYSYDGASFQLETSGFDLHNFQLMPDSSIIMFGSTRIHHYDGINWTTIKYPIINRPTNIFIDLEGDIWVSGHFGGIWEKVGGINGVWQDRSYDYYAFIQAGHNTIMVFDSANTAWGIGSGGRFKTLSQGDTTWVDVPGYLEILVVNEERGSDNILSMAIDSLNRIYLAGREGFYIHDGINWVRDKNGNTPFTDSRLKGLNNLKYYPDISDSTDLIVGSRGDKLSLIYIDVKPVLPIVPRPILVDSSLVVEAYNQTESEAILTVRLETTDNLRITEIDSVRGSTNIQTYLAGIWKSSNASSLFLFDYRYEIVADSINTYISIEAWVATGDTTIYSEPLEFHIVVNKINTAVEPVQTNSLPTEYLLGQNYPNPFNPTTIIQFTIPTREHIRIVVYDIHGKLVEVLHDDTENPGTYRSEFGGSEHASGIYFVTLKAGSFTQTKKMLLLK